MDENTTAKSGGLKGGLMLLAFGALVGSGAGYYLGNEQGSKEQSRLEKLATYPVAEGFLNYPNEYQVDVRLNPDKQRVVYIKDMRQGIAVPMSEKSFELMNAYQGKGEYVLDFAMAFIKGGRKGYSMLGGDPAGPVRLPEEEK